MKQKSSITALLVMLLFLMMMVEGQSINVKGETLGPSLVMIVSEPDGVKIFSPKNEVYNVSSILLNFTAEAFMSIDDVGFSLDGGSVERVSNLTLIRSEPNLDVSPRGVFFDVTYRCYLLLSNLSDGNHSVSVYQGWQGDEEYHVLAYSDVYFSVDTSSPKISVLSPEPKVYNVSDISLNYTINEPVQKVEYSLDKQDNVTITGNIMFSNMTSGVHNVTVYGWDTVGNIGSSETVTFTISKPESAEPFPIVPVTAVSVAFAIVVVLISLQLLFRKRRRKEILTLGEK
jgi:hypothetical protein